MLCTRPPTCNFFRLSGDPSPKSTVDPPGYNRGSAGTLHGGMPGGLNGNGGDATGGVGGKGGLWDTHSAPGLQWSVSMTSVVHDNFFEGLCSSTICFTRS